MAENNVTKRVIEPLDPTKHDRAAFSCEQESLDKYLKEHATQDIKKRVAAVYVLTPDGKAIAGYYTLSQYAIEAGELPPELVQQLHLPKYDKLPATLLGRLARNKEFKGHGLEELLLMGALKRALEHSRNIASVSRRNIASDASPSNSDVLPLWDKTFTPGSSQGRKAGCSGSTPVSIYAT